MKVNSDILEYKSWLLLDLKSGKHIFVLKMMINEEIFDLF